MRTDRSILMFASLAVVVLLLGGGLWVKSSANESSYEQAVLFAEILSLVTENYVDPVEVDRLLDGAYESMLGGLDPNSAYLDPQELADWKRRASASGVGAGVSLLKLGRNVQVVAVEEGSPAAEAGVEVGDQVQAIDGTEVAEMSLQQVRALLVGDAGSKVVMTVVHPYDDFDQEELSWARRAPRQAPYALDVEEGVGVLTVRDLARIDAARLRDELGSLPARGAGELLVDLRNVADANPRDALTLIGALAGPARLQRRDVAGEVVEVLEVPEAEAKRAWDGELKLLVNGATAGGSEAVVKALKSELDVTVYGEETFGLAGEAELLPLDNGGALLVSSSRWELADGESWDKSGVSPDEVVRGEGEVFAEVAADQKARVIALIRAADGEAG